MRSIYLIILCTIVVLVTLLLPHVKSVAVAGPDSGEDKTASTDSEKEVWEVVSSGATEGSSESYLLMGTACQTAVGEGASSGFALSQGYWQDFILVTECCGLYTGGMTGNTNCDVDGKRNLADISKLIDRVYITKVPLCCEENGNVNGDIENKINLADISRLIDHVYISKEETAGCL